MGYGQQYFAIEYINVAFHTTQVVCVIFIHEWRQLSFNIDSERQIFLRNFSMVGLFTLRVFAC